MEGSHTWTGSIHMYVLPWKAAILEPGPYTCTCWHGRQPDLKWVYIRVHFWLEVVTLNPVNNQTGKRHFICVSMATNQDFHRTLVTVVHCHLLLIYLLFCYLYSCWPLFFASEKKLDFFFFLLMPSFTKAKTFAKCPSVYKNLLLFIFAFPMNNSCEHFFYLLCNGGGRLPTAVHLPPWI